MRDDQGPNWTRGLVRFSTQAHAAFPGSTVDDIARTLFRNQVSGYTVLDDKRTASIKIQPTLARFVAAFELLTDGLLKGLDWSNVFIAGGMVLGSLLSADLEQGLSRFKHSDADVYLYGLNPIQANEKIQHIYDVWKSNLPKDSPVSVLRNSRTVCRTFHASGEFTDLELAIRSPFSPPTQ